MTADGPSSSGSKPLILLLPTARLARGFFTTVMRRPFSRSRRRIRLVLVALMPRGLITATPSRSLKRSDISFSIRLLTFLLMSHLFLLHVEIDRRCHRALEHDLLEKRPLARRRLEPMQMGDHRIDVIHQLLFFEADFAD